MHRVIIYHSGKVLINQVAPVSLWIWHASYFSKTPGASPWYFFAVAGIWIVMAIGFTFFEIKGVKSFKDKVVSTYTEKISITENDRNRYIRALENLDEMEASIAKQLPYLSECTENPVEKCREIFSLETCINKVVTAIYFFYKNDPKNRTDQWYRITFMEPISEDELKIKYFQTNNGDPPISFENSQTFKKDYTNTAGYSWLTKIHYKIPDIEEHIKKFEHTTDCHFQIFHREQRDLRSIFSIPVFDEPKNGGHFYGVLNIDTNKRERFRKIEPGRGKDPQLEIIKPFIKRIEYFYRLDYLTYQMERDQ